MDYSYILSRAWRISFKYRSLWLFGFLLALCGGGGKSYSSGNFNFNFPGTSIGMADEFFKLESDTVALLTVGVISLLALWVIGGLVMRPIATTAIISLGQKIEEEEAVSIKLGWQLGWSRRAWRVFLVDIIIGFTAALAFIITLCAAFSPLALFFVDHAVARIIGGGATAALFCLWIILAVVFGVFISPFIELSKRYVVLADMKATRAIENAYRLLRGKLKDVTVAAIIIVGLNMGWQFISSFVLIGFGVGTLVVGLLAVRINETGFATLQPLIVAIAVLFGAALFFLWLMFSGFFLLFQLTFWTIAFKEINFMYY